jgi:hypothetical protein
MNPELERGRLVTSHAGSLLGLALLLFSSLVEATAFSVADGNWSVAGTWSATACGAAAGGGIPAANETVVICNNTSVTVNGTQTAMVVFINAGGALLGGTGRLVLQGTPAIQRSGTGTFIPGTGTVAINRNNTTTIVNATAMAASVMTFNNLEISPTMNAGRVYTLGANQVRQLIVNGDFVIIPLDNTAGNARTLTVNVGTLTAATVVGMLQLDVRTGTGSNDVIVFNTGDIPWTAGRIEIGGTGTGAKTFNAGASIITLNGGTGALIERGAGGVFTDGTSNVVISPSADVALNSGAFTGANTFSTLTIDAPGRIVTLSATGGDDVAAATELRIIDGTLVTNSRAVTGAGAFSVGPASTFTMSGTSVFPTGFGTYTFEATSTTRYLQTDNQAVSPRNYGNLQVAPTANSPTVHTFAAGTATVAGNLTIGNGANTGLVSLATNSATLDVAGAVSVSAGATLIAHATNPFLLAGNWVNAGAFSAGTTSTLTLDGTSAQTLTGATTFRNLTSANTNASGVSMSGTQTVNGTMTLGANPFIVGANLLELNGPTIAGTPTSLSAGATSSLTFGGNTAGVNLPSNVTSLNNLSVGNSVAAQTALTLNNNLSVGGVLTLNTGVVTPGANLLTVSANCPGSVVRNGTTSLGWVESELRLTFPAGAVTCNFPIGDAAAGGGVYAGMQLALGAGSTAGGLTAAVTREEHRNTTAGTSGINPLLSVNRYWTLKNSNVAGTYTGTFTYVAGDNDGGTPANYRVRRGATCAGTGVARNCTPWGSLTISGTPTNTVTSASGITITADTPAQADFSIGEADASANLQREKQFIYTRELY